MDYENELAESTKRIHEWIEDRVDSEIAYQRIFDQFWTTWEETGFLLSYSSMLTPGLYIPREQIYDLLKEE